MVISRVAHVAFGAGDDADALLRFYGELFGVVEVARTASTVFLSGGKKPGFDVAFGPWPCGLHHFAFEVAGDSNLREAEERLRAAGVAVEEVDAAEEPGIAAGRRFVLPSGHVMELVVAAEPAAFPGTPALDARHFRGVGPVELEHVTLDFADVGETARFLVETLDFRITDYSQPPGGAWFLAFLRCRDIHHDLGMFRNNEWDGPGFNHVGFVVPSFSELVRAADTAAVLGHLLQCSPGRHLIGDNVFIYLLDPAGNRVEIATPAAKIDPAAPPRGFTASGDANWRGFDAWRNAIPPAARTAGRCWDARVSA